MFERVECQWSKRKGANGNTVASEGELGRECSVETAGGPLLWPEGGRLQCEGNSRASSVWYSRMWRESIYNWVGGASV